MNPDNLKLTEGQQEFMDGLEAVGIKCQPKRYFDSDTTDDFTFTTDNGLTIGYSATNSTGGKTFDAWFKSGVMLFEYKNDDAGRRAFAEDYLRIKDKHNENADVECKCNNCGKWVPADEALFEPFVGRICKDCVSNGYKLDSWEDIGPLD